MLVVFSNHAFPIPHLGMQLLLSHELGMPTSSRCAAGLRWERVFGEVWENLKSSPSAVITGEGPVSEDRAASSIRGSSRGSTGSHWDHVTFPPLLTSGPTLAIAKELGLDTANTEVEKGM